MKKQVFINLPVANLKKSMDFYTKLGFTNNPQFTDETAACMVLSDEIFVMLLTHPKFKDFTNKQIADTQKTVAVINAISVGSNDEVNSTVDRALSAGAVETKPAQDYGFMQLRSFADLDGHQWEIFFMDMSKMPQN